MTWSTFPGLHYQFEHTNNPASGHFTTVGPIIPGSALDFTQAATLTLQKGRDFVRVRRR
jgi:hypothetical protein